MGVPPCRAVGALLAATLVAAACSGPDDREPGGGESRDPSPSASTSTTVADVGPEDFAAIRRLMATRARAVRTGDREGFLATVDTHDPAEVAEQRDLFTNLAGLPVTRLYYGVSDFGLVADPVPGADRTVRPVVYEHVQLDGPLTRPVSNATVLTFAERDGRWRVAAEDPPEDEQDQQLRPWFGGPIEVSATGGLLAVADAGGPVPSRDLLARVRASLVDVARVLGVPAPGRLLVDATSHGTIGTLSLGSDVEAGAVAFRAAQLDRLGEEVQGKAGSGIKFNPRLVERMLRNDVLLRHELTHVVLDRYNATAPIWATEGIADVVATDPELLSRDAFLPARLHRRILAREAELVPTSDWGEDPGADYTIARAAVEYLIEREGMARFLDLLERFRRDATNPFGQTVEDRTLQRVYGLSRDRLGLETFALIRSVPAF